MQNPEGNVVYGQVLKELDTLIDANRFARATFKREVGDKLLDLRQKHKTKELCKACAEEKEFNRYWVWEKLRQGRLLLHGSVSGVMGRCADYSKAHDHQS